MTGISRPTVWLVGALIWVLAAWPALAQEPPAQHHFVPRAAQPPVIDGNDADPAWEAAEWRALDHLMVGTMPAEEDFSGRYKLVWTRENLFLLAEITDDVLIDTHADPLQQYWDDDALEIFVDEDASGGLHLDSYNAFAYHIALDNQAVDRGPPQDEDSGQNPNDFIRTFPEHIESVWQRSGEYPHTVIWEVAITLFADDFNDYPAPDSPNSPVNLHAGKELGFMLAYCDADSPAGREHFLGDVLVEPVAGDRNRGYIDASVFGRITLTDQPLKPKK